MPFHTLPAPLALAVIMCFDAAGLALGWKVLGHAAHLGGAAFGLAFFHGFAVRKSRRKDKKYSLYCQLIFLFIYLQHDSPLYIPFNARQCSPGTRSARAWLKTRSGN
jgi:hypothetical protein